MDGASRLGPEGDNPPAATAPVAVKTVQREPAVRQPSWLLSARVRVRVEGAGDLCGDPENRRMRGAVAILRAWRGRGPSSPSDGAAGPNLQPGRCLPATGVCAARARCSRWRQGGHHKKDAVRRRGRFDRRWPGPPAFRQVGSTRAEASPRPHGCLCRLLLLGLAVSVGSGSRVAGGTGWTTRSPDFFREPRPSGGRH